MRSWLWLSVIVLFGVSNSLLTSSSWATDLTIGEQRKNELSLPELVQRFVNAEDADEGRVLAKRIAVHPEATVEAVSLLLQGARRYAKMPVGIQPDQPIRVQGRVYRYGLFVPPFYDPSRSYGLIVCLHGAGFTGDSYLKRWVPRLKGDYLLACPTMSDGAWWTRQAEELVLATVAAVRSRYHIDSNKLFLTGMSNGGIGTWLIGMHRADQFAGIAPMASGIDDVLYPFLDNLRQTAVYVIHGLYDRVMPVWLSRELVNELDRRGIRYVYREHHYRHPHAGGHFFPREELPGLIAWFDEQARHSLPRHVTVVRDATHLQSFSWVRIDVTDRIAAFSENLIDSRDELIEGKVYAKLDAKIIRPNDITVSTTHVKRYSLFLNDQLIDFSRPITIRTNGIVTYQGMVHPSLSTLLREVRLRKDTSVLYPAQLTIDVTN
ncbi:MAG: hypothetical protein D6690_17665 [Nitrospirae bacterium]|nr:MAG: hypothetical protein D6690_17665 [Nitrospirota bacterium]